MPRQQRRGAFDLDRDVRADSPTPEPQQAPAATASGLLPKLDNTLPPLEATPAETSQDHEPDHEASAGSRRSVRSSDATPGEGRPAGGRPRGTGGRPTGTGKDAEGIIKVPARVPAQLYDEALPLVTGIGRPSWGQLVAWTCQDNGPAVLVELTEQDQRAGVDRRPRGQNRQGTAGLQVTARLNAEEFAVFDEVMKQATRKTESDVTRTKVVIAALTVATRVAASSS